MGNRAVIATKNKDIGVYLHWNGGRDSVEAFLTFCKIKKFRCPEDDCYGWAYLCTVIGNFFGDGLSLGVDKYECLPKNNYDNGTYIIENWEIVGREFFEEDWDEQNEYELEDMLEDINNAQPKQLQITSVELEEYNKANNTNLTLGE